MTSQPPKERASGYFKFHQLTPWQKDEASRWAYQTNTFPDPYIYGIRDHRIVSRGLPVMSFLSPVSQREFMGI